MEWFPSSENVPGSECINEKCRCPEGMVIEKVKYTDEQRCVPGAVPCMQTGDCLSLDDRLICTGEYTYAHSLHNRTDKLPSRMKIDT